MGDGKLVEPDRYIRKDSGKRFDVPPDPRTRTKAPKGGHGQGGKGN